MDILTQLQIENATIKDAPRILDIQKEAFQVEVKTYGTSDLPPITQTLESFVNDFKNYVYLKAVFGGQIIGSVRAYVKDDTCFIGRLIVLPEYHNKGIGSKLMVEIERKFKHMTRFELFTGKKSEDNIHFYTRRGYKIFNQFFENGNIELVMMEKINA